MFTPWGSFEPIQISALDPFGCLPALVLMGSWTQLLQLLEPQISIQALPEKEMLKDVSAWDTQIWWVEGGEKNVFQCFLLLTSPLSGSSLALLTSQ